MTENDTAEMVVVRHLGDIESAIRFLEDVMEPKFWSAVASCMEKWAKSRGWAGHFDPNSDDYLWFGSGDWHTVGGGKDEYDFWFELRPIWGDADEDDTTGLASFIGASARGNYRALVFDRTVPKKKRAWQALLGESDAVLQLLRELGFNTDTRAGVISYPLTLDPMLLGPALADDDFDEVLEPLATALAKIVRAQPLFEQLIISARASE